MNYETKIADYEQELDWSAAQAKRKRRIILGVAVAVLALALGYWMYSSNKADEKAALAAKGENKSAPTVTVIIPGRQMVDSNLSATGSLAARREMPVGVVGEGGMVTKVWVEPGSWVQAGQVLATIERSVQVQQTGRRPTHASRRTNCNALRRLPGAVSSPRPKSTARPRSAMPLPRAFAWHRRNWVKIVRASGGSISVRLPPVLC